MKRVGKALIIAGSMLLVGIIILVINLTVIEKHVNQLQQEAQADTKKMTEQTYRADGDAVNIIRIDVLSEDVQIEPTAGTEIELIYYDNPENPSYTITQNGSAIELSRKSTMSVGTSDFVVWDIEELLLDVDEVLVSTITVRIPECYLGSYGIDTLSGNVSMHDVPADGEIMINTTSGDVDLATIEGQKDIYIDSTGGYQTLTDVSVATGIRMYSTSGNHKLTNVVSNGDVNFETTTGAIELDRIEIVGNLSANTTDGNAYAEDVTVSGCMQFDAASGSLTGKQMSIGDLYLDTTSGDINIVELTLVNGCVGDSVSGNFEVSVTDRMSNYHIEYDTVSGDVTLPDNYHTENARYIDISTVSGNIEFTFGE